MQPRRWSSRSLAYCQEDDTKEEEGHGLQAEEKVGYLKTLVAFRFAFVMSCTCFMAKNMLNGPFCNHFGLALFDGRNC
jgi:hypothetical protein